MRRTPSSATASIGLTETRRAVETNLGWLFRDQPTEDYGIDAHAEVVAKGLVTGKLLALQIKSGGSWFSDPGKDGWWFRPDPEHVNYWTNHSLPVVVVLYNPETKRCHWQLINRQTLVETPKGGWKVLVPAAQVLSESARDSLEKAAGGDPYRLRIRELQLAKPWMNILASGKRLVIDMEEWVNKMSGRGSITLGIDNENGQDPAPIANWSFLVGPSDYSEAACRLFPWADLDVHQETYDDAEYAQFETECAVWDDEITFYTEKFREWRAAKEARGLRPYEYGGEVDYYRFELTLNDLGKGFLLIDKFAEEGRELLTP